MQKPKKTAANDLRLKEDRLRRGARRDEEGEKEVAGGAKEGTQHLEEAIC